VVLCGYDNEKDEDGQLGTEVDGIRRRSIGRATSLKVVEGRKFG